MLDINICRYLNIPTSARGRILCQARYLRFIGYISTIYQFMLSFHQVHVK